MLHQELTRTLKCESTWKLLALAIVTCGVYVFHYIADQTRHINYCLADSMHIPVGLVRAIGVLSYVSLALFLGYFFVDEQHPIAVLGNYAGCAWSLLVLAWGFYATNRMNTISGARPDDPRWFHGLWTFLFTPLYFNYKVNVLNDLYLEARPAA
jgi:hypothetical protein